MMKPFAFGSWPSPLSAAQVAASGMSSRGTLRGIAVSPEGVVWRQVLTSEAGRSQLFRLSADGQPVPLLPAGFSAQTKVHEYGGGDFFLAGATIYFSNNADQRLYRLDPAAEPVGLTPPPADGWELRFADGCPHPEGGWLVTIVEEHTADGHQPENYLAAMGTEPGSALVRLSAGHDFYSSPRFDPAGQQLCWLTWDHPNLPWDGTDLWVADCADGRLTSEPVHVAGGQSESIYQPSWGPDEKLYFVSDRTGWWNLYRWDGSRIEALAPIEAEVGSPAWVFDSSRYTFLSDGAIALVITQGGFDQLAILEPGRKSPTIIETGLTAFNPVQLRSDGRRRLWFNASSPTQSQALFGLDLDSGAMAKLAQPSQIELTPEQISIPEAIEYPSAAGRPAYALFYPPASDQYTGLPGELPPLVVTIHGGPTSRAVAQLDPELQYFTSRGFAVVDVNHAGSTGYGRPYRESLYGLWGLAEVEDCLHAARYLAGLGRVDDQRLLIRGGSAGGYSSLAALVGTHTFAAAAAYYPVTDIEVLAGETHKFEARYDENLIGPYPEARQLYRERSPISHLDQIRTPLIVFQGTDDKVVTPGQSRMLVDALDQRGLPHAYLEFEGEAHGFTRQETIVRCLEAELSFFGQILGFEPSGGITPVEVRHLEGSRR
jgi:dipeptidyl aminopeptidase/acylaminoacyl peptidase